MKSSEIGLEKIEVGWDNYEFEPTAIAVVILLTILAIDPT